jgi:hypothetical protein
MKACAAAAAGFAATAIVMAGANAPRISARGERQASDVDGPGMNGKPRLELGEEVRRPERHAGSHHGAARSW